MRQTRQRSRAAPTRRSAPTTADTGRTGNQDLPQPDSPSQQDGPARRADARDQRPAGRGCHAQGAGRHGKRPPRSPPCELTPKTPTRPSLRPGRPTSCKPGSGKPSATSRCPAFPPPRPSAGRRLASPARRQQTEVQEGQAWTRSRSPSLLPATVTRPRPLIEAVMTQSLREQGPGSRTAAAWRWVLTGQGPSPVSRTLGTGTPPSADDITAEARCDSTPPECGWPPWRYAHDPDPDRQQARRVLRWLTGAADAIPLLDPGRGRYVGARFHFARTDEEIRRVRGWALHGLREHGDLPDDMPRWQAERPWQWPAGWMNAAWLRGTIAYLDWILGDQNTAPLSAPAPAADPVPLAAPDPPYSQANCRVPGVVGVADIEHELGVTSHAVTMQGHEAPATRRAGPIPAAAVGRGVEQAHDWVTGEDRKPPADHHGCGDYYPCPGAGAAPARPPDTACAASARPAPTASATRHGPRSRKATEAFFRAVSTQRQDQDHSLMARCEGSGAGRASPSPAPGLEVTLLRELCYPESDSEINSSDGTSLIARLVTGRSPSSSSA